MLSILPDVIIYSLFRKRTPKNVSMFCSIVVCSCFSNTTVEEVRSFTTVPTSKSFISDTAVSPSLSQDICSLYRTFLQNTIVKHSFRRHSHQKKAAAPQSCDLFPILPICYFRYTVFPRATTS